MSKIVLLFAIVASGFACQRNYTCVCTKDVSQEDTLVEYIKTTKLGSKGYEKTCKANAEKHIGVSNCRVR